MKAQRLNGYGRLQNCLRYSPHPSVMMLLGSSNRGCDSMRKCIDEPGLKAREGG